MTAPAHVLAAVRSIPHPRQEPDMTAPFRPWYACNANPCTCPKPGRTPDLSSAEAARVAEFDAAPEPSEIVVERVARAIFDASNPITETFPDYWLRVRNGEETRDHYRRLAAAAIAAVPIGRPASIRAMLDVADNLDYYASKTAGGTHASGLEDAAAQIRDTIAAID